ncbi:MAG: aminotransferase class I/II-fold pyridoxal phosphate-dependent enzyme, partial [Candidatus Polarisedimenticolia bacterium]
MDRFPGPLAARLEALHAAGLHRALRRPSGFDLSSNDYLGFAADPDLASRARDALRGVPGGAGASRLLRGDLELHHECEAALARFAGREAAVLFPSGYQANLALLSSLLRPGDRIFSDALNHASIIDGIRLGRGTKMIYPHADAAGLEALLARHTPPPGSSRFVVTESLFSMDGDRAPLADLAAVAERHGAHLIVDEAHATGLYGGGAGLAREAGIADRVFASVHTGGKALGAAGAWVAGDRRLKEYLVNFARPFVFSTAVLPALAVLLRESVAFWADHGPERAAEVLARAGALRGWLREAGVETPRPAERAA